MKKILLTLCFLTATLGAYAQKSYVNMVSTHHTWDYSDPTRPIIRLTGNVPSNMENTYKEGTITAGDVLNLLANEGFIVEQYSMSGWASGTFYQTFLLSKSSSGPNNAVRSVQIDDEDVIEVARYNLQGIPVNENEKGVQIIVYSNYTTKTIIVQ